MKHLYVAICSFSYGMGWNLTEAVEKCFANVSHVYGAGGTLYLRRFTVEQNATFSAVDMDDIGNLSWADKYTPSVRKMEVPFPTEWFDLWQKARDAYEIVTCTDEYDTFDTDDLSETAPVNTEQANQ